jgi:D-alanyl-D-alanine carboxypeptidase
MLGLPAVSAAAASATAPRSRSGRAAVVRAAQRVVDTTVRTHHELPGVVAHVDAPRLRLSRSFAAGSTTAPRRTRLPVNATFRFASNTKTYTAAAILRLAELGALSVDDPIAGRLPDELAALVPRADEITIDMLLRHAGGLYDYAEDPAFQQKVFGEPQHHWTRAEQVAWALDHGRPYGEPGKVVHYSDTGYVLLGAVIERATGMSLGDALPQLLGFGRLGLRATWLEDGRPPPLGAGPLQHQYGGGRDMTGADPSFDLYGGGGLVGTAGDLASFWSALFHGRVLGAQALAAMQQVPDGGDTAAGLFRGQFDRRGAVSWSHAGFWGTLAVHVPKLDATVTVSIGRAGVPEDVLYGVAATMLRAVAAAQR